MKRLFVVLCVLVLILGGYGIAAALTTFQWTTGPGANNHWYGVETVNNSWNDAKTAAETLLSIGGVNWHLATITSSNEQDAIIQNLLNFLNPGPRDHYWIGGKFKRF